VVVAIKALACELPDEHGLPLARLSVPEIRRVRISLMVNARFAPS
jgi:hypothetical protein